MLILWEAFVAWVGNAFVRIFDEIAFAINATAETITILTVGRARYAQMQIERLEQENAELDARIMANLVAIEKYRRGELPQPPPGLTMEEAAEAMTKAFG